VEKAEKTPPDQPLEGQQISEPVAGDHGCAQPERRESYRGRPTIVFRFCGPQGLAKTHGMAEDASKKLQGTMWIDEADRQVAHLEVSFNDNFHIGGGLVASVQKGSSFRFDQALVNGEIWLPTGAREPCRPASAGEGHSPARHRARLRLQALPRGDRAGEGRKVCRRKKP
jgi:hypothetical protein